MQTELDVIHRSFQSDGAQIHFVEKGEGPLVVLLHGFPESWWSFRHQLDALVQAGFRVVAPDLRGYGQSEQRGAFDRDQLTRDVRNLLQHLEAPRAHVVGHDIGGMVAWQLAATSPELVERVAVLNAPHPTMYMRALKRRGKQLLHSWYVFFFQLPVLPELVLRAGRGAALRALFRRSAVDRRHFDNQEIAPFIDAAMKPGALSAMLGPYRALTRRDAARPHLPRITVPVMLVWGMRDRAGLFDELVPGTEEYVASLRVERIASAGHFVHAERPELVNPMLLGFLAATDVARPLEAVRRSA